MKKITIIFLFFFLFFSCNTNSLENKLPTDVFNYTDDLINKMKILSLKTSFCDIESEIIILKTNKFCITNKYIIPYFYGSLIKNSKPIENYEKNEIDEHFYYIAKDIALKYALYYESIDKEINVTDDEINYQLNLITSGKIDEISKNTQNSIFKTNYYLEKARISASINKYINKLKEDIQISESQISSFYENNKSIGFIPERAIVRQILISTKGLNEKQKAKKFFVIQNLLNDIKKGKDFSQLAKTFSDDPASSNSGGRLGDYIEKGKIEKLFDNITFSTPVGSVSEIFETDFGYHIVKVDKIEKEGRKSLSEVKDEIINILKNENLNKIISDETKRLERKYNIKI
jgi:parvulin-like peptidyl-prolyl isomerase